MDAAGAIASPNHGSPTVLPVPYNPDTNTLEPTGRIKNVGEVVAMWASYWFADFENMQMRTLIQQILDGWPPYGLIRDRQLAQSGRTNVNWGFVRRAFQKEVAPYNEVLETMDPMFFIPTKYGTENDRLWIEPILSEEITRTIKGWSEFQLRWMETVHLFLSEAVAIEFFEDEFNWQWSVKGMQYMKFPRRVHPSINSMDGWCCKVDMLVSDLEKYVKNPEYAKKAGWNPEQVHSSISKAAPVAWIPSDTQEWQRIAKNLEILPVMTAPMVETLHCWDKELNGTYSHYICRYDGTGDFLYKKVGKYRNAEDFGNMYVTGVGTNGDLHSIRSFTHHLFNAGVAMDRALSAACDAVIQQATSVIEVPNEDGLNALSIRMMGPFMAMNQGIKFVKQEVAPFQQTLLPWFETCKSVFDNETNDSSTSNGDRKGPYMSKDEQQTRTMSANSTSSESMMLFFGVKERMMRQIIRRLCRRSYAQNEPGGVEVWELRNRLKARGVDLEYLYQIDFGAVEINTGIGRGSTNARRVALDAFMERIGMFDPEGQQIILRNWSTINSNPRFARQLVPIKPGMRPPHDVEDAQNENGLLASGDPIIALAPKVLQNQNHEVHCQVHLEMLTGIFQINSQGQLPTDQAVSRMQPLHAHAVQHWELMDPGSPNKKAFKATLQQMNEFIVNESKHIAAEQAKAQAQGGQPGQGGEEQSPGLLRESIEAEGALQANTQKQQQHEFDMQQQKSKLDKSKLDVALQVQKLQQGAQKTTTE